MTIFSEAMCQPATSVAVSPLLPLQLPRIEFLSIASNVTVLDSPVESVKRKSPVTHGLIPALAIRKARR